MELRAVWLFFFFFFFLLQSLDPGTTLYTRDKCSYCTILGYGEENGLMKLLQSLTY